MTSREQIQEQLDVFAEYLKKNGLKMTRQRKLVAESFLKTDGHLSTDELHELVRREAPGIGLATVFRTLKALTDCGLASETHLHDGRTRFEHTYKRPHHHHIVCEECGRAIEFLSPEWEQIQNEVVSQYGFRATRHSVRIFGVCEECQKHEAHDQGVYDSDLVFARDALKIAMETETRGVNFYSTAAELVKSESTRETFLKMLEEEQGHFATLKKQWDELIEANREVLKAPVFLHFDYDALNNIFPSREEVKSVLNSDLTAEEALRVAMNMERDAYNFFSQYAERFSDTRGRDIFLKFAEEEQDHYNIIKEELDQLLARQ